MPHISSVLEQCLSVPVDGLLHILFASLELITENHELEDRSQDVCCEEMTSTPPSCVKVISGLGDRNQRIW